MNPSSLRIAGHVDASRDAATEAYFAGVEYASDVYARARPRVGFDDLLEAMSDWPEDRRRMFMEMLGRDSAAGAGNLILATLDGLVEDEADAVRAEDDLEAKEAQRDLADHF